MAPRQRPAWPAGVRAKLGLRADDDGPEVTLVVDELLALLESCRVDVTSGFRGLSAVARGRTEAHERLGYRAAFDARAERWLALRPDADAMDRMNRCTSRNHLVEEALAAPSERNLGRSDRPSMR